jgi:HTH-type transcriptional regulator/antitoxin HipB
MSDSLSLMIHQHRKAANLTQVQLAEMAGVGKTLIFDLEKGRMSVRHDKLLRVLSILNIKISYLSPLEDVNGEA